MRVVVWYGIIESTFLYYKKKLASLVLLYFAKIHGPTTFAKNYWWQKLSEQIYQLSDHYDWDRFQKPKTLDLKSVASYTLDWCSTTATIVEPLPFNRFQPILTILVTIQFVIKILSIKQFISKLFETLNTYKRKSDTEQESYLSPSDE